MAEKRPLASRGQGRKALSPTGEVMGAHTIRMTRNEWLKLKMLGGPKWVRAAIRTAKVDSENNYPKSPGVYLIANTENGRIYIGSSKNIRNRFYQHITDLRRNCHANWRLQADWNEFGEHAFKFSVHQLSNTKDIEMIEKNLISEKIGDGCYNFSPTTGRPPMPPEKRLVQRSIRLTPDQWSIVDEMGLEWLRKQIQDEPPPVLTGFES